MSSSPEYEGKKERPDGEPLSPGRQSQAERALGRDLSGVRLHHGAEAAALTEREGARAVTRGQQIYFAPQEWALDGREGERLLAHELAHAAQAAPGGGATTERAALEGEADRAADAMLAGERPGLRLRAPGGLSLKAEARAAPSIQRHGEEIAPQPASGTVAGAGLTIPYLYSSVPGPGSASLVLQLSEGMAAVATALTMEPAELRVQNADGTRARALVLSVPGQARASAPRVQVTFTRGSSSLVVLFQFPPAAPPAAAAPAPVKGRP
jgi:hypothetical protein